MKKIFIFIFTIGLIGCNCSKEETFMPFECTYDTFNINIFDTIAYFNFWQKTEAERKEYYNSEEYYANNKYSTLFSKYENGTLWLWYNIDDIHRYEGVGYKDVITNLYKDGLKLYVQKLRVYYYISTGETIIVTILQTNDIYHPENDTLFSNGASYYNVPKHISHYNVEELNDTLKYI